LEKFDRKGLNWKSLIEKDLNRKSLNKEQYNVLGSLVFILC